MNRIYKLVFNRRLLLWQVVSERSKGQGKGSSALVNARPHPAYDDVSTLAPRTAMPLLLVLNLALFGCGSAMAGALVGGGTPSGDVVGDAIGNTDYGKVVYDSRGQSSFYDESGNTILGAQAGSEGELVFQGGGAQLVGLLVILLLVRQAKVV